MSNDPEIVQVLCNEIYLKIPYTYLINTVYPL